MNPRKPVVGGIMIAVVCFLGAALVPARAEGTTPHYAGEITYLSNPNSFSGIVNPPVLLSWMPGALGGGSGGGPFQEVTFTIFFNDPANPMPPFDVRFGELNISLGDGAIGIYDFNSANAANFETFAALLTNDTNDLLTQGVEHGFNGGYSMTTESGYGFHATFGAELAFARLVVAELNVDEGSPSSYQTQYLWEFWGTPVPEPGSLLLLGVGGVLLTRRYGRALNLRSMHAIR